ncbi:ArsR/SmtB family transcription factor [Enterococcus sp. BWR-S5]|uniref:ArsR/SmtB family transcription factor n=1 Tax=Enterococcus sp. BWR-S5 TaxID=2787714 RepID=UPI001924F756|nr:metalloregulator ArsR/SmtB family transcription factor [Enterococcus sp. BWR-S5]MBL1224566.1 helix-turn-helix transcriptional regulator [Enterococcus sp. BWR-S5]
MEKYEQTSVILKALADPKRLKIIDLLSAAESLCACDVLEHFDFTQPTLSHHMKILEKAGIVKVEKRSQWHHYSLQEEFVQQFLSDLKGVLLSESAVS